MILLMKDLSNPLSLKKFNFELNTDPNNHQYLNQILLNIIHQIILMILII